MYQFLDGNLIVQFMLVFVLIAIVFAFCLYWFMEFEITKSINYKSKHVERYQEQFSEVEKKCHDLVNANAEKDKEINRLGDHGTKLANKITELGIGINDYLDQIAESLGKQVTRKSWRDKTESGKMATILKKIEKM